MSPEGVVPRSLVSIVDDDESVRESLPELIRQFGFDARTFASAEAFLASEFVNDTSCLVLDIAMKTLVTSDGAAADIRRRFLIVSELDDASQVVLRQVSSSVNGR